MGVDNELFFASTAISGPPIPLFEGISIDTGFVLGSRVTTSSSAPKSPGLNGTVSWKDLHAGTGPDPGIEAGFSWSVVWSSFDKGPDDPVFTPIFNPTNPFTMKVGDPDFNGLAASNLDVKLSLVPQIQLNLTLGISSPITADVTLPFTISPTVYLDMQTGDPGSTPPSGVSAHCPDKFDTWFALMYGSDLDIGFGGLDLEVDIPVKGKITYTTQPTATATPLVTPAPLPGDTSGCVSKTWVPPAPPGPGPNNNGGGGGGASPAAIAGGIVGALLVLGVVVAFLTVPALKKLWKPTVEGGESDYAAAALN